MKFCVLLLAFAMLAGTLRANDPSPAAVECYQWFGGLGFPDPQKTVFVRYTDGGWTDYGKGRHQLQRHGFLLGDTKENFRILTPVLQEEEHIKSKPDVPDFEKVGWEEMEFHEYAKTHLNKLQRPQEFSLAKRFGERLSEPAEIFFVAYAAWRRDLPAVSQELFEEAVKAGSPADGFRTQLEKDLGHAAMWRAILAFGGGEWGREENLVTRKELLVMFENIIKRYPASEYMARAKETAEMLRRMIAEDEAHPVITDEALKKLPVAERVEELIFRLRDQNGRQVSQPGWCDIFGYGNKDTPAHQLVETGLDAVPALITALSDKRFCRSVGFWRDFRFSHQVLTVGDCALAILQRIAGRGFYTRRSTSSYMSSEGEEGTTRKAVEAWWEGVRKKGIKQTLIEQISSGEIAPAELHDKLGAIDAGAAGPALLAGAGKAQDAWIKASFFELLGALPDQSARDFLLRRMRVEKTAAGRVSAIKALAQTKRQDVLKALIKEWRDFRTAKPDDGGFFDQRHTFESMVELLAGWRSAESVNAMGKGWDKRGASGRWEICEALARALGPDGFFNEPKDRPAAPAEAVAAGERILVRALEDIDARVSSSGTYGEWAFSNPSVADIANWALHQIKPNTYAFSSNKASRMVRETERLTALNTWRKANGKPLLPVPPAPAKLAAANAMQIVAVIVNAPSGKAGARLKETVEALKGGKFSENTLPSLCRDYVSHETRGIAGMTIEAFRDEDLTGVTIRLTLSAGKYPGDSGSWNHDSYLYFGDEVLLSSSGAGTRDHLMTDRGWEDEVKQLGKIIKAPPEASFEVRFLIGDAN